MTTLYRTPNIIIDAHEWHAIVWVKQRHAMVAYRWRPVATRTYAWQSIQTWKGPKPLGMWRFFQPYKKHIQFALDCEKRRREAVAHLAGKNTPPTGAMVRNPPSRVIWDAGTSATIC